MTNRFCRFELRTSAPDLAIAFYAAVLGADFQNAGLGVTQLPAQAAARGAPSHWVGQIGVADVTATTERLLVLGATRLGPASGASTATIVKDPFGAVVACVPEPANEGSTLVAWAQLNVADDADAFDWYAEVFGWTPLERTALPFDGGRQQTFGWRGSGVPAGAITNAASLPHIHPHWLFYFQTPSVANAIDTVQRLGGTPLGRFQTPIGVMAPCEDAQGAMFGLLQSETD